MQGGEGVGLDIELFLIWVQESGRVCLESYFS